LPPRKAAITFRFETGGSWEKNGLTAAGEERGRSYSIFYAVVPVM